MRIDDPNLQIFQKWQLRNLTAFFLILVVRGPFYKKDFNRKKYGGTRLISEKNRFPSRT